MAWASVGSVLGFVTSSLLLFFPVIHTTAATLESFDHGKAFADWLIQHGGHIHPQLQFQHQGPFYGMFAQQTIHKDEVLLEIPRPLVVTPIPPPAVVSPGDRVNVYFDEESLQEWFSGTVEVVEVTHYDDDDDEDDEAPGDSTLLMHVRFDDGDYVAVDTTAQTWEYDWELDCATVRRVLDEDKKGDQSIVAPYLAYLQNQPRGQVPSAWSDAGKDLFREVLGLEHGPKAMSLLTYRDISSTTLLPPIFEESRYKGEDFLKRCEHVLRLETAQEEADAVNFFHLLNQRGWDELMIPVFDMLSHGNGRLLNTYHDSVRDDDTNGDTVAKVIRLYALRDIPAGEEIRTTYNFCQNCQNRFMGYGTPELLRDYGFVEGFPQRWFFEDRDIAFALDQEPGSKNVTLEWLLPRPTKPEAFEFLVRQRLRLLNLSKTFLKDKALYDRYDETMPQHEFDTLQQYQKALIVAIEECLKSANIAFNFDDNDDDKSCDAGNTDPQCPLTLDYDDYEKLEFRHPNDEEWEDGRPYACARGPNLAFHPYHAQQTINLETVASPYQDILFYQNVERNHDTCFSLDLVTQICTSYRPDYHEMIVHNTARYLEEDLKRVVFVGGGDSMLLHDIVKYPSLEKVVGLEIDQLVPRASFAYFGTQPHWDDPRVEWWFGDASKSLLMLPRDYFGSFDLVLVDLSETAASLSVTDHLNVMEALSLLLKPKGILVKNEYNYFPEQSSVFHHSLHIHYYNVTNVCSQSLILGSNGIDFMRGSYSNSRSDGIDYLFKKRLDDPNIRYGYMHDYQRNYTNPIEYCIDNASKKEEGQEKSPGIFMVIEAEDTKIDLEKLQSVQSLMEKALARSGFEVKTSFTPRDNLAVVVLAQGYVIAHTYPAEQYVAFDFQLWSSFEKQDSGKRALIEAMGSDFNGNSSSSYRVVTGGMLGISSWKDDEEKRGPKLKTCDELEKETPTKKYEQFDTMRNIEVTVQESLGVIKDVSGDLIVAVLCGNGNTCQLEAAMKEAAEVVVLKACDGDQGSTPMADCELELWNTLNEAMTKKESKIRAIVLDPTADENLAKLVIKLMLSPINKKVFFTENLTVTAPLVDLSEDWRRAFVDIYRTHVIPDDPTHRAELYFNSTTSSFMVAMANNGDFNFGQSLVEFIDKTEVRTQMTGEIENIRGSTFDGFLIDDPHLVPDNFTDADFDQKGQLDHWVSQVPLGFQVIFQFELTSERAKTIQQPDSIQSLFDKGLMKTVLDHSEPVQYETFDDTGQGFLIIGYWSDGSAVLLYDGNQHMDVTIFSSKEDKDSIHDFERIFSECPTSNPKCDSSGITRTLRDSQPRGKGRVVSFLADLGGMDESGKPLKTPHWAAKE